MSKTAIKCCSGCRKHEYQDEKYGPKRRVMNEAKGPAGDVAWRCTVCGTKR